jgi:hypothetical protein
MIKLKKQENSRHNKKEKDKKNQTRIRKHDGEKW